MENKDFQQSLYSKIYKETEYTSPLPDYKITDNKKITGRHILSIGSGTSRDIWHLAEKNNVIALDYSRNIRETLKKHGIRLKYFEIQKKLPFADNSFDIVIAKDILEHLNYPYEICQEINRVLKPDGYAVINVPNHFCLPMRLKYLFGGNLIWKTPGINHEKTFEEWNYMHIRYFTWNGFKKMLDTSGLKVIRTFFDILTLNHYSDPDLVKRYFSRHRYSGLISTLINIMGFVFPKPIRVGIAGMAPNLLSGSFYVWVRRK